MKKDVMRVALISLAAFAAVAIIQRKVQVVPVIGGYLPGGTSA